MNVAQLLVRLADHVVDERLLGYEAAQALELLERLVPLLHGEQDGGAMELAQRVARLDGQRLVEYVERSVALLERVVDDRYVAHERRAVLVDEQRLLQVALGQVELLLLEVDHADAVPGVVVALVQEDGATEARHAFVHLLDQKVLNNLRTK